MSALRLAVLVPAALLLFCGPASAATRYADPGGSGPEPCMDRANPCSLKRAVEDAGPGDLVRLIHGTYDLTETIDASAPNLVIDGDTDVPGASDGPPALLRRTGDPALVVFGANTTLQDLEIVGTDVGGSGAVVSMQAAGRLERLRVTALGASGAGLLFKGGIVRDSLFRSVDRPLGIGIITGGSGSPTVGKVQNVTAIATGPSSNGIGVLSSYGAQQAVTIRNTIARGTATDIHAESGGTLSLDVAHSNFIDAVPAPPGVTVALGAGNQTVEPAFANAAAGNFAQLRSSPTVNAGVVDDTLGSGDFEGHPRIIGGAPDIGADEAILASTAETAGVSEVTTTSALLSGFGNSNGGAVQFGFEVGESTAYGLSLTALATPFGLVREPVSARITGLRPGTSYHYRLVADEILLGGPVDSAGADATFTTLAEPATSPAAPKRCAKRKRGTARAQTLRGSSLGDRLLGLGGNDVLRGLAGADCLLGGRGNDKLFGGSGDDALNGGAGKDAFSAGPGADTVKAKDGVKERIACGPGRDTVVADRKDRVRGCERVRRAG